MFLGGESRRGISVIIEDIWEDVFNNNIKHSFSGRKDGFSMIKYLQRLKNKKGFTLVELIVVIAIIAILAAMGVAAMIDRNASKYVTATANAQSFFVSMQLTSTKAGLAERSLVKYNLTDKKFIEYKDGVNTTNGKYLFVEVHCSESGIEFLHLENYIDVLMNREESSPMTALENYLSESIEPSLSEAYDGYFYATVDPSFKVVATHFSDYRFPLCTAVGGTAYNSKIRLTGEKMGNIVVGTCSDTVMPEYAFGYNTSLSCVFFSA